VAGGTTLDNTLGESTTLAGALDRGAFLGGRGLDGAAGILNPSLILRGAFGGFIDVEGA
jgi:hypothetical protein